MAWIESHQELAHHPKVARLSYMLDVEPPHAIGHLHCLWWWALSYADDGDLTQFEPWEIATAAQWRGDADLFVKALIECGWLDETEDIRLEIHDWWSYAGKLVERRQESAKRKRSMRSFYADGTADVIKKRDGKRCRYCGKGVNWSDRRSKDGATYDHLDPYGPETEENIVVACRGCNSQKGQRTPEEAGMELLPPPNPIKSASSASSSADQAGFSTQPNQPNQPNPTAENFEDFHKQRCLKKARANGARSPEAYARSLIGKPDEIEESEFRWEHRDCSECNYGYRSVYAAGAGNVEVKCST